MATAREDGPRQKGVEAFHQWPMFQKKYNGLNEMNESAAPGTPPPVMSQASCLSHPKQATNYKEGLTPVLTLLTEGSRHHRHIRRYIKAQVSHAPTPPALIGWVPLTCPSKSALIGLVPPTLH